MVKERSTRLVWERQAERGSPRVSSRNSDREPNQIDDRRAFACLSLVRKELWRNFSLPSPIE